MLNCIYEVVFLVYVVNGKCSYNRMVYVLICCVYFVRFNIVFRIIIFMKGDVMLD